MGLRFRKSLNLGKGFKLNLSKSGIGYSFGFKGFRIGKTAKGKNIVNYISLENNEYVVKTLATRISRMTQTKVTTFIFFSLSNPPSR